MYPFLRTKHGFICQDTLIGKIIELKTSKVLKRILYIQSKLAVSRRRIFGPIFVHNAINAQRYKEEVLMNQLDDEKIQCGFFQQHEATAHTT